MLPEGHTIAIGCPGRVILSRHWQPSPPTRSRQSSDESLLTGYREVLRNAVSDRVAGRRCTIFLSGGMDSTSLAAVGVECASEMRAVTFGYQRFDIADEVPLARSVAETFSLPLEVISGDADVALEAERIGAAPALPVDEPSLSNWRAGLRVAASFSTLAVYGEDGDALFAPPGGAALLSAQSVPSVFRGTIASLATQGRLPYLGIRLRERLRWTAPALDVDAPWLAPEARRLADSPEEPQVLGQPLQPVDIDPGKGRAWERLLRNIPRGFAIAISPDVTRQRLAVTLPLMDSRVIDFVMSVPPIPWCQNKRLARLAFAECLPSAVLIRRKTPGGGLDAALVETWRRHHPAALPSLGGLVGVTGWIQPERWAEAVEHGSPGIAMAAWRVLLLDAWLSRAARRIACTV
jgi:asparagine synthase (glutamine-hydrolysing)